MAYPGKKYNFGSMFREKDVGNLLQMIFECGDFFRYRNMELIADSHFGHMVPVAFLRLWDIFATFAARPSRLGVSHIPELVSKELSKEEMAKLLDGKFKEKVKEDASDESDYSEVMNLEELDEKLRKERTSFGRVKSRLKFFEKDLGTKPRGYYRVWSTKLQLFPGRSVVIYLHAVLDSKVVYRMSNLYAALPKVPMELVIPNVETGKKEKVEILTSPAHRCYRKFLGFNDQSDAKRSLIGLSAKFFKRWTQKLTAKPIEDAIINSYLNYLLDFSCRVEPFTVFLYNLVEELLETGENMRKRKSYNNAMMTAEEQKEKHGFVRSHKRGMKRSRPGSPTTVARGKKCPGGKYSISIKWLAPNKRSRICASCGKSKAKFKCRACSAHLCMEPPRGGPANGTSCFHRYHGTEKYTAIRIFFT